MIFFSWEKKSFLMNFSVPGPPKGVKAVVKSPRSVIVSWLEPEQPNGVVERYHIYLRSVSSLAIIHCRTVKLNM